MANKQSIKQAILEYLEKENEWVFGGTLDREIDARTNAKESNVSRRCRELENSGGIEQRKVQINGVGIWVVQYKIAKELTQQSII